MTIKKRLAAKVGKYVDKAGKEKSRTQNVGHLHDGQYGDYLTLDVQPLLGACLAAVVRGEDRLMVSLYDVDEDGGKPRGTKPGREELDDPIPF
jgi:hypothetical protein